MPRCWFWFACVCESHKARVVSLWPSGTGVEVHTAGEGSIPTVFRDEYTFYTGHTDKQKLVAQKNKASHGGRPVIWVSDATRPER